MITEDYVSFETAKLLKEKGFDCKVTRSYFENDGIYAPCDPSDVQRKDAIAIPTLQMAMKWLREVHGLHCNIILSYNKWDPCVMELKKYRIPKNYLSSCDTYEQACEAAIKYCLKNLI
jgi:hypothetical protein